MLRIILLIILLSLSLSSNDLIKNFNYKPETRLADGIAEFVEWYKKFYKFKISFGEL